MPLSAIWKSSISVHSGLSRGALAALICLGAGRAHAAVAKHASIDVAAELAPTLAKAFKVIRDANYPADSLGVPLRRALALDLNPDRPDPQTCRINILLEALLEQSGQPPVLETANPSALRKMIEAQIIAKGPERTLEAMKAMAEFAAAHAGMAARWAETGEYTRHKIIDPVTRFEFLEDSAWVNDYLLDPDQVLRLRQMRPEVKAQADAELARRKDDESAREAASTQMSAARKSRPAGKDGIDSRQIPAMFSELKDLAKNGDHRAFWDRFQEQQGHVLEAAEQGTINRANAIDFLDNVRGLKRKYRVPVELSDSVILKEAAFDPDDAAFLRLTESASLRDPGVTVEELRARLMDAVPAALRLQSRPPAPNIRTIWQVAKIASYFEGMVERAERSKQWLQQKAAYRALAHGVGIIGSLDDMYKIYWNFYRENGGDRKLSRWTLVERFVPSGLLSLFMLLLRMPWLLTGTVGVMALAALIHHGPFGRANRVDKAFDRLFQAKRILEAGVKAESKHRHEP